ncbi:MAG: hypothetical protein JNM80_14430 [Phycisphaerae bacterium]|nr:hypothetical protein [Phycisphaerae bacterium]
MIDIRRFASAGATIKESAVTMVKEHFVGFAQNKATGAYVGTALATASYGSSTDVWNTPFPTANLYKAANFGVLLGYDNDTVGSDDGAVVMVDSVAVTVYFDVISCDSPTGGPVWAGSAASNTWTNAMDAADAPDGHGAIGVSTSGTTTYLFCSNFPLPTIPSDHVIDGVEVTIVAKVTGACQRWHYVSPWASNAQVGRGKYPFVEPTTGFVDHTIGHCEDTWPLEPPGAQNQFTPAMFNDRSFFVAIAFEKTHPGASSTAEIDAVSVAVWSHAP